MMSLAAVLLAVSDIGVISPQNISEDRQLLSRRYEEGEKLTRTKPLARRTLRVA